MCKFWCSTLISLSITVISDHLLKQIKNDNVMNSALKKYSKFAVWHSYFILLFIPIFNTCPARTGYVFKQISNQIQVC